MKPQHDHEKVVELLGGPYDGEIICLPRLHYDYAILRRVNLSLLEGDRGAYKPPPTVMESYFYCDRKPTDTQVDELFIYEGRQK